MWGKANGQTCEPANLRTCEGTVKSPVNPEKGCGFIECAEVKAQFGRDGFLHVKQCPWAEATCLRLGERVAFNMSPHDKGEGLVSRIAIVDR